MYVMPPTICDEYFKTHSTHHTTLHTQRETEEEEKVKKVLQHKKVEEHQLPFYLIQCHDWKLCARMEDDMVSEMCSERRLCR